MTLRLYNTLTRDKEDFEPIDASSVRMYVCGPTVYDFAHIGNARPLIVFDVLFRVLRLLYGPDHVIYVRNITDVEDKINARAAQERISIASLTDRTTRQFHEDVAALGCLLPTVEPRATDHIPEMIELIERLVRSGHAYEAEGHVLFHVPSMPDYGRLSRRSPDEMLAGARVDVAPYKRDPGDFVLWKPSGEGEPAWESPWGPGRPGWHIECSAMSWKHLGTVFDIHGGGIDLVFPHHENEIAQSRCAHGTALMARFWIHNGFLQVEGEKMSKSLGNFITVRELLADWPGEVIRLAMLTTHYRQPMNWTLAGLKEAERVLDSMYEAVGGAAGRVPPSGPFLQGLLDDLNTPRALAALHELRSEAQRRSDAAADELRASAALLGLVQQNPGEWAAGRKAALTVDSERIERLIARRGEARKARNFAEADRIRDELAAMGVALKDSPEGTSWEIAR